MCCSFYVYMTLVYGSALSLGKLRRFYIVKRGYIRDPGSRRHHVAWGRFDRGVPPAGTATTQGGGFQVAPLHPPPRGAGDPPPHHSSVLLATDGQGHQPDGQGLPTVPEGQSPQTHTPTTRRDPCSSPPFRPPPRGPGRATAAVTRPHLPVYHPIILLLNFVKRPSSNALVKISATCSLVPTWYTLMVPLFTSSLKWWYLMFR